MIVIDVKKEKNLESTLKKFKYKVLKTKQNEQIRERQEFVKPSVIKRSRKLKAIYRQEIKSNEEKSN